MKGDHRQPATGRQKPFGGVKTAFQLAQFVVHMKPQRLDRPGCRINAVARRPNHRANDAGQLAGPGDGGFFARRDNGRRHLPRPAFFAQAIDDVGQGLFVQRVDQIGRAGAAAAHPHVQGTVFAEGKAPFGVIQLWRGHAQIQGDSVDLLVG